MEIDNNILFVCAILLVFAYMYHSRIADENRRYGFVIDNYISTTKNKSGTSEGMKKSPDDANPKRQFNPVVFD